MKNRKYELLLHPIFVISILLLLLNDIYLKYALRNWITGKLSDFTGLFAFIIFLLVFFPGYKKTVIIFCGLLFTWWKSAFSQSFINGINSFSPFQLARIVDYSDLIALTVLPGVYFISDKIYDPDIPYRRVCLNLICIASLFAFCNTSAPRYAMYYTGQETVEYNGIFSSSTSEEDILAKFSSLGFHYYKDSVVYYPVANSLRNPFYRYADSSVVWRLAIDKKDPSLYRSQAEQPFYIIPVYSFDGNTIRDLKLRIDTGGYKKRGITIHISCTQQVGYTDYYYNKLKRKYTRHFTSLFK